MGLYSRESCSQCGTCLELCPVLSLGRGEASDSIRSLAAGQWVSEVLARCTGCMSCDALCPSGANPYGLLLERYRERYVSSGIPRVFCNAMPQREGPNIWRGLERWLSPAEKEDLSRWSRPPDSREVLFLGCNQRLTPYVARTVLFKDITVFTDPSECCGEYYLRLGLVEEAREKAASLSRRFEELGIRKVVAFCPACQNTIQRLAPLALGVDFDVEVTGLVEWLESRVRQGDVVLSRKLEGTVTVQDPCHASGLGEEVIASVRYLLSQTGLRVLEMENNGLEAECCAIGASVARYRLSDVMRTGMHRARQARATGASRTCAWCNGCYMVMNMFRLVYPLQPPVYHLLELIQLAAGEEPLRQVPARSLQLLAAAVESTARDGFHFGRTHI